MVEVFSFFKEKSTTGISNQFYNSSGRYTDGIIEIKGTATSFSIKVEGCVDIEGPIQWTELCCVNEKDLSTGSNLIAKSIYDFGCAGKNIRINIVSISGGNVTVTGRFIG